MNSPHPSGSRLAWLAGFHARLACFACGRETRREGNGFWLHYAHGPLTAPFLKRN